MPWRAERPVRITSPTKREGHALRRSQSHHEKSGRERSYEAGGREDRLLDSPNTWRTPPTPRFRLNLFLTKRCISLFQLRTLKVRSVGWTLNDGSAPSIVLIINRSRNTRIKLKIKPWDCFRRAECRQLKVPHGPRIPPAFPRMWTSG